MNIAIDARWIFPEISGIGAYTRELIKHLAQIDNANSYTLFFDNPQVRDRTIAETGLNKAGKFSTRLLPFSVFSIRNQLQLPAILANSGLDIYHSTNYMIPVFAFPRRRRGKVKCVVTIHDVIPLLFPNAAPKSKKARLFPIYKRLMVEIGSRADAIITDSKASRKDVISHLRIPAGSQETVRAIYCGVSPQFTPPGDGHRTVKPSAQPDTGKRTILYVGRLDPYKNVSTLIKAFFSATKLCPFPLELVIAGSLDSRYPETSRLTSELGIEKQVRWTGYISDTQLVETYRNADLLVHPSRYEGFGLQIAEAMACGVPVICSNAGSIPEVAGDAAILLDPGDTDGFAGKIRQVLTDPVAIRNMSIKGIAQAGRFSWSRTARETLSVYEEVARA